MKAKGPIALAAMLFFYEAVRAILQGLGYHLFKAQDLACFVTMMVTVPLLLALLAKKRTRTQ